MPPITSPENDLLKEVRKLTSRKWRDKLGRFVAEGEDLVEAAEAAGWHPVAKLVLPGCGIEGEEVAPHLLAELSTLGSGTRVIGLFDARWATDLGRRCVALWGVGDPGNVGTVIRAAHAFGATSVALGPQSADPFSPKAVRASMGAVFHVPVKRVKNLEELPAPRLALVARAGLPLADSAVGIVPRGGGPAAPPASLLVGAERDGLPEDLVAACDATAHIPIAGESLNAAMAATVALYETDGAARRALGDGGAESDAGSDPAADKVGPRA